MLWKMLLRARAPAGGTGLPCLGSFLIQSQRAGSMVAHGFNPRLRKRIQEDVFEFQARLVYTANLRPAWSTQWITGQAELHSGNLCQKQKKKKMCFLSWNQLPQIQWFLFIGLVFVCSFSGDRFSLCSPGWPGGLGLKVCTVPTTRPAQISVLILSRY